MSSNIVLINFKSPEARAKFAALSAANSAIAEYMQQHYELTAVNKENGDIVILEDGKEFELDGYWTPTIFMSERRYFDIEEI